MEHEPSRSQIIESLQQAAHQLSEALAGASASTQARSQELDELIHEARTYAHRRAARIARDQGCYRTGSAFEPHGGHLLDDVALAGFDHLGAFGILLLMPIALTHPRKSLSWLLTELFASEAGAAIREWGKWSRLRWLHNLYWKETAFFLSSEKGWDPKARWRSEKPTASQKHLVREISRVLQLAEPTFAKRGDAFDWLKAQGGNPRFASAPPMPTLPASEGSTR